MTKRFEWIHQDECHDFEGEGWRCSNCGLELGPENTFVVEYCPRCPQCGALHKEADNPTITNYEKYFGSPEKVAKTLEVADWCPVDVTKGFRDWENCEYRPCGGIRCDEYMLEWLQEECDEASKL